MIYATIVLLTIVIFQARVIRNLRRELEKSRKIITFTAAFSAIVVLANLITWKSKK